MIGDSGSVFGRVTARLRIDEETPEGGTSWRRSVAVGVPAIVAIGAMTAAMAQGALAASFAVSGTNFQVSSGKLTSNGLGSYVGTDKDIKGDGHSVALLHIGDATLSDICQAARIKTPLGDVVFKLTAGGQAGPVTAKSLIIDAEDLNGDAEFGTVEIGRDASTLDKVAGAKGDPGAFGLQAGQVTVSNVKSNAWAATGGDFKLKGLNLSVKLGGQGCF
ncbi:DUF6230 family protein [Yinghuangia soli]|uniref:DUF6230 family protein n=1 Tax=Yinghuangia soli TaxID=2908204 RepID=A0AA41TWJ3_9ACTN|nr:DUF6230 family protein [Yinghuangia soli]MCF2525913.1 DUF6230 family protein [Yinghuangia soli]